MLQDQPFDIESLLSAYAGGLRPAAVVEEVYRRLTAAADPGIFLHVADRDAALREVAALGPFDPAAKPLWGIPFAIKDNIDAAGTPTTAACPAFTYYAEQDAFVVERLRRAGAILIGKTNLDQFATGLVGLRTPYAAPRNALDPTIVPGGSSSGSAVAVARDIVSFTLGTDTAGSGRVPAALNGIVGLKPSLGALSNTGVVPACRTLDTVSVFARTVADAYRVFRVAAANDPADAYSRPTAPPPSRLALPPPSFRVGVPDAASRRFEGDEAQAQSFDAALVSLAALGAKIVEVDFTPFNQVAEMLYDGPWVAERYAVVEDLLRRDPAAVHSVTRRVIEVAARFSSADVFRAMYRLQELKRGIDPLLAGLDMMCVPSIPTFYTVADVEADPFGPNTSLGTYTNFVNLLDMCAMTVPTAPRRDGRPGSVTLLAAAGRDAQIAAVARALEPGSAEPACDVRPAAATDEIALAVVGAHMSGLPLNHELTRLGARFLHAAETSRDYRLFSLPGGPPARPGLLRAHGPEEGGRAIALEVWALPAGCLGDFIRGVPRPLGIGTLTLDDGAEVKGFLCEASGTAGAEDVTAHGGWRAYLDSHASTQPSKSPRTQESDHV
jgi:allophanate hydrolase